MLERLTGRHVARAGAGLLLVALTGCSGGSPQAVAKTTTTPPPAPTTTSAPTTPEPTTPTTTVAPTAAAPVKVDCTAPTVTVTKVVSHSEKFPDVARDTVFNSISPSTVAMTYTNHSTNPINVSYLTMRFGWRNVPGADRATDMVSPMDIDTNMGRPTLDPDLRMLPGASDKTTYVFPAAANIHTPSTALTVTAFAHWTFASPALEATCHLIPARTIRVGTIKDGAPFTMTRTRTVPGAVLADVKLCVAATAGSDAILDASTMWAVTATGAKVSAVGSENPKAKAAGAGRLTVPVKSQTCRTTTVAFLTGLKVTLVVAPGDQGVPWRWKL